MNRKLLDKIFKDIEYIKGKQINGITEENVDVDYIMLGINHFNEIRKLQNLKDNHQFIQYTENERKMLLAGIPVLLTSLDENYFKVVEKIDESPFAERFRNVKNLDIKLHPENYKKYPPFK